MKKAYFRPNKEKTYYWIIEKKIVTFRKHQFLKFNASILSKMVRRGALLFVYFAFLKYIFNYKSGANISDSWLIQLRMID